MRVLIIGCGYVGLPLGASLVRAGHEVYGLRRHLAPELENAGLRSLAADVAEPSSLKLLPTGFDWVINTVAAGGTADQYRRVYRDGTRNVMEWLRESPPARFVYTSSTSVYGQNDGSIVSEESATEPDTQTGEVLLETERLLLDAARKGDLPAMVLRCAGIYGPGRGYWLQQFLRGEARIEGTGESWLNMIHQEDVRAAVLAALERGCPGEIYNVVDDEPVRQREVFAWLAARLGRPMPAPADAASARKRGASNKRVSNRKLRLELRCGLTYPTFREGYAAELDRLGVRAG